MLRRRILILAVVLLPVLIVANALCNLKLPRVGVAAPWPTLANVTVVNPGSPPRPRQTVTLRDGRIDSIADANPNAPKSLAHLFEGRYVLPGLIDMNVRLPAWPGMRQALGVYFLYAGVTTVRDVGNFDGDLTSFLRRIDAGETLWPRLVACGQVVEGEKPGCPASRSMRGVDDVTAVVDALAASGAQCVRVGAVLPADIHAALRAAAHVKGLSLIEPTALGAARDTSLPPSMFPLRTIAPNGAESLTLTLTRWFGLFPQPEPAVGTDAPVEFLPRAYRAAVDRSLADARAALAGCADTAACSANQAQAAAILDAVRRLRSEGAPLVVGSGAPATGVAPGFSLRQEMQMLHAAGFSLDEVWVAATRTAGEVLGIPQLGVIEPGAPADLLIFGEDPTQSLEAFSTLQAVVLRGRLYLPQPRVYMAMDHIKYFEQWLYDWSTRLWGFLADWRDPVSTRACVAL